MQKTFKSSRREFNNLNINEVLKSRGRGVALMAEEGPSGSRFLTRAKPLLISRKRNRFASGFKIKLGGIIKVFKTNRFPNEKITF